MTLHPGNAGTVPCQTCRSPHVLAVTQAPEPAPALRRACWKCPPSTRLAQQEMSGLASSLGLAPGSEAHRWFPCLLQTTEGGVECLPPPQTWASGPLCPGTCRTVPPVTSCGPHCVLSARPGQRGLSQTHLRAYRSSPSPRGHAVSAPHGCRVLRLQSDEKAAGRCRGRGASPRGHPARSPLLAAGPASPAALHVLQACHRPLLPERRTAACGVQGHQPHLQSTPGRPLTWLMTHSVLSNWAACVSMAMGSSPTVATHQ